MLDDDGLTFWPRMHETMGTAHSVAGFSSTRPPHRRAHFHDTRPSRPLAPPPPLPPSSRLGDVTRVDGWWGESQLRVLGLLELLEDRGRRVMPRRVR